MPDETDANKILTASPQRTGGAGADVHAWHYALLVVHARNE